MHEIIIFCSALTVVPLCYFLNLYESILTERDVLLIGLSILIMLLAVAHFFQPKSLKEKPDFFYWVASIGCLSGIVNLLIALENDYIIRGFVDFYLNKGEPYLRTAYGTLICYWDGIFHLLVYLTSLSAMSWGQDYRDVALVWCGSILNSLVVFVSGFLLNTHPVIWSAILNVPFVVVSIWATFYFMGQSSKNVVDKKFSKNFSSSRTPKIIVFDIFLLTLTVLLFFFNIFRALAAISGESSLLYSSFVKNYDPYLMDSFFSRLQIIAYGFYLNLFYIVYIWGLIIPNKIIVYDWCLFFLGAICQGQFSYMGSAIHSRTPLKNRQSINCKYFWFTNSIIISQIIFAFLRVYLYPNHFGGVHPRSLTEFSPSQSKKGRIMDKNS